MEKKSKYMHKRPTYMERDLYIWERDQYIHILKTWVPHSSRVRTCMYEKETCTRNKRDLHVWKETYMYTCQKPGFLTHRDRGPVCIEKRPIHGEKRPYMRKRDQYIWKRDLHIRNLGSWLIETEALFRQNQRNVPIFFALMYGKYCIYHIFFTYMYVNVTSPYPVPCSKSINVMSPLGLPCVSIIPCIHRIKHVFMYMPMSRPHTGLRRLVGSPKLQIIFHRRATKYRSLLWKTTYKNEGSCQSWPPFTLCPAWSYVEHIYMYVCVYACACACACACVCACACECACAYACAFVCACACACACACVIMCACMCVQVLILVTQIRQTKKRK